MAEKGFDALIGAINDLSKVFGKMTLKYERAVEGAADIAGGQEEAYGKSFTKSQAKFINQNLKKAAYFQKRSEAFQKKYDALGEKIRKTQESRRTTAKKFAEQAKKLKAGMALAYSAGQHKRFTALQVQHGLLRASAASRIQGISKNINKMRGGRTPLLQNVAQSKIQSQTASMSVRAASMQGILKSSAMGNAFTTSLAAFSKAFGVASVVVALTTKTLRYFNDKLKESANIINKYSQFSFSGLRAATQLYIADLKRNIYISKNMAIQAQVFTKAQIKSINAWKSTDLAMEKFSLTMGTIAANISTFFAGAFKDISENIDLLTIGLEWTLNALGKGFSNAVDMMMTGIEKAFKFFGINIGQHVPMPPLKVDLGANDLIIKHLQDAINKAFGWNKGGGLPPQGLGQQAFGHGAPPAAPGEEQKPGKKKIWGDLQKQQQQQGGQAPPQAGQPAPPAAPQQPGMAPPDQGGIVPGQGVPVPALPGNQGVLPVVPPGQGGWKRRPKAPQGQQQQPGANLDPIQEEAMKALPGIEKQNEAKRRAAERAQKKANDAAKRAANRRAAKVQEGRLNEEGIPRNLIKPGEPEDETTKKMRDVLGKQAAFLNEQIRITEPINGVLVSSIFHEPGRGYGRNLGYVGPGLG